MRDELTRELMTELKALLAALVKYAPTVEQLNVLAREPLPLPTEPLPLELVALGLQYPDPHDEGEG